MATLITSDGVFLNVEFGLITRCSVLKSMHEECHCDLFPLPNVNCKVLMKIVEFYRTGMLTEVELNILIAADYLGYEELLDYGAKRVADGLRGKSAPEIRRYFGISPVS